MKTSYKNIGSQILLLLFLTAFGGEVFASANFRTGPDREHNNHSVSHQDKVALFADEVSVSEASESFQDNQPEPLFFDFQYFHNSLTGIHSKIKIISASVPADIRTRIEQQIFPFHFFW